VQADILSRVFGMILGTLVVNMIAVVGAMFVVRNWPDTENRAWCVRARRTPKDAWRILLIRPRANSLLFDCSGGSNSLIR
jgi:hypothetical protein